MTIPIGGGEIEANPSSGRLTSRKRELEGHAILRRKEGSWTPERKTVCEWNWFNYSESRKTSWTPEPWEPRMKEKSLAQSECSFPVKSIFSRVAYVLAGLATLANASWLVVYLEHYFANKLSTVPRGARRMVAVMAACDGCSLIFRAASSTRSGRAAQIRRRRRTAHQTCWARETE
jgi:hypothetical protein